MNTALLLQWVLEDAEKGERYYQTEVDTKEGLYKVLLKDLQNLGGDSIILPSPLPPTPAKAVPFLRKHFKDNVTLISRVLNHYFPDRYLFYRVSKLENEIFDAFHFFSPVVPEFGFPFTRIGRTGVDRYLVMNEVLMKLFKEEYPELEDLQARIAWFLYEGLGGLFVEKSDYHRYWILATREEYFAELDSEDSLTWSGRKKMQSGDLVFIYRTAPRSAITDVLEVVDGPRFDP